MKSTVYDSVTLPIIAPAELFPEKTAAGTDTFRIHFPPIGRPRRIGDQKPYIPPEPTERAVVELKSSDLRTKWRGLEQTVKKDLTRALTLGRAISTPKSLRFFAQLYHDMLVQIYGEEGNEMDIPWTPEALAQIRKKIPTYEPMKSKRLARDFQPEERHASMVGGLVSFDLQKARLVLWWSHRRFTPAIWCPDLATAFRALALPIFAGSETLGLCRWCKEIFCRRRSDQEYCCKRHSECHRVSRWRAKQRRRKLRLSKAKVAAPRRKRRLLGLQRRKD